MDREEALRLRARVLESGLDRVGRKRTGALAEEGSVLAEPAPGAEPANPAQPTTRLAVGIQGEREDFTLAVRAVRDDEEVRAAVSEIEAVGPVDFQMVGPIVALAKPWYQSKVRPLWPGASAAYWRVPQGTLGCFVSLRNDPTRWPHILSNNHVLAREREDANPRLNDSVVQPAPKDDDDTLDDTVATLSHWIPLQVEGNRVDAAIARLQEGIAWQPSALDGLGELRGVRPSDEPLNTGDPVHKIGRTTGLRTGSVKALHLEPLPVGYATKDRSFLNVLEIESVGCEQFCDSGDSGSLVVDGDLRAVALLFAKADAAGTAYCNPIHEVLDLLAVDLLLEVTT